MLPPHVSAAVERKFTAYQKDTLRSVDVFKYLGRNIARDDCDTPAIRRNLKRTSQVWGRISKVITKEEVQPTAPEQREYGAEGEGNTPTPTASRARVALQARPTIAEEKPREAMPVTDAATEALWRAAHIND